MSEENNETTPTKDEPVVEVSQETVEAVNEEVVSEQKVVADEAVAKANEETVKSLDAMKKELEETKAATKKLSDEQEMVRVQSEIDAEKKKLEDAQRPKSKAVVPETPNPVVAPEPEKVPEVDVPIDQQWAEFDVKSKLGAFSAAGKFDK